MKGTVSLYARLQALPSACQKAAEKAAEAAAEAVLDQAKRRVPVRTGFLRSSLGVHKKKKRHLVRTSCSYALYVEKGTRYMKARPYLTPAVQKAQYPARVSQAIKEAIR